MLIPSEILARYSVKPPEDESEYIVVYSTFLSETDYVITKLSEAFLLGEEVENDYTEVINYRKIARDEIVRLRD